MSKKTALLITGDLAIIIGATFLAVMLRLGPTGGMEYMYNHLLSFVSIWIIYVITFYVADLYNHRHVFHAVDAEQILMMFVAVAVALFVVTFLFYALVELRIGRGVVLLNSLFTAASIMVWRYIYGRVIESVIPGTRILIVGAGRRGKKLLHSIRDSKGHTFDVVGFVDDDPSKIGTEVEGKKVFGGIEQLREFVIQYRIEEVVLAIGTYKSDSILEIAVECRLQNIRVVELVDFYVENFGRIPLDCVDLGWLYANSKSLFSFYYYALKRIEDVIVAAIGLAISLPVILATAIIIKLDSKGTVFYRQTRIGLNGKHFTLVKFRSMKDGAETRNPIWSSEKDSRITKVGRFLRKSRIDEIPQLINVLKGEMSLIGPRPEREFFIQMFLGMTSDAEKKPSVVFAGEDKSDNTQLQVATQHSPILRIDSRGVNGAIPYYSTRLFAKPGITGWAQVNYGYVNSREGTRDKLEYDLYYTLNQSLILDLRIMLQTVKVVLLGKGT